MRSSIAAAGLWLGAAHSLTILPPTKPIDSTKAPLAASTQSFEILGYSPDIVFDRQDEPNKPKMAFNHTWDASIKVYNETDGVSSVVSFSWQEGQGPSEQWLPPSYTFGIGSEDNFWFTRTFIVPGLYERLGVKCTKGRSCVSEVDEACLNLISYSLTYTDARESENRTVLRYPDYYDVEFGLHPICFGAPYSKSDLDNITALLIDEPKERIKGYSLIGFGSGQPVMHGFDGYSGSNLSHSELANFAIARPWFMFVSEMRNFSSGVAFITPSAADNSTKTSQDKSATDKPTSSSTGEASSKDGKKSLAVQAAPALWMIPIALLWWF